MASSNLARFLERNQDRFGAAPGRLYLNPPPDLADADADIGLFTQDYAAWRSFRARKADVRFGTFPQTEAPARSAFVLCVPRERALLDLWLRWASAALQAGQVLWLAGENRAGARSCGSLLGQYFTDWGKVDSARHCALYRARAAAAGAAFSEADAFLDWSEAIASIRVELSSLPGVFAHGRLDDGTRLLLETVDPGALSGQVLDFGCGNGIVATVLKRLRPELTVQAVDSSALALASARRTFQRNQVEVGLTPSDGLSDVSGSYAAVVSNPPFHQGVHTDSELSPRLLHTVRNFLVPGGQLLLVANRHLPYRRWLDAAFGQSDVLGRDGRYHVLRAVA